MSEKTFEQIMGEILDKISKDTMRSLAESDAKRSLRTSHPFTFRETEPWYCSGPETRWLEMPEELRKECLDDPRMGHIFRRLFGPQGAKP